MSVTTPPGSTVPTSRPPLPLDELAFDNRFTGELPADPEPANVRRQVHAAAYSRVTPTPVASPRTLAWSPEVADLLGLGPEVCQSDDFAAVFSGSRMPVGADPFAMAYAGHQFGSFAGQLGDGRAIALGEVLDRDGGHQMLQLKGSGPTPYSRTADGRAVLRSSLREYVCSEAMAHLGVPTTRALSLVATGEDVVRDMLYDGRPAPEPGAVVCRVAPSFTRFGSFQLPASRNDMDLLGRLVAHTVRHDFTELAADWGPTPAEYVPALFAEVCDRTATLAAHWMRVGFVHGVLNTDNMSILGLTIDYGPYGWLENFDTGWTPNTTDAAMRRYRYGAQPQVMQWNLLQLANALIGLTDDPDPLQAAVDGYSRAYTERFRAATTERLGWGAPIDGDDARIEALFAVLSRTEIDQVRFFRDLADVPVDADGLLDDEALLTPLAAAWYRPEEIGGDVAAALVGWLRDWSARVTAGGVGDDDRRRRMDAVNPLFVPRNYLAQQAIDAAEQGDLGELHELLDVLRRPYDDQPGRERFAERRPEWARNRVGCSQLSCSS